MIVMPLRRAPTPESDSEQSAIRREADSLATEVAAGSAEKSIRPLRKSAEPDGRDDPKGQRPMSQCQTEDAPVSFRMSLRRHSEAPGRRPEFDAKFPPVPRRAREKNDNIYGQVTFSKGVPTGEAF
jgi:hypothetical protein